MEKLIEALLTDENGISEESFNALFEHLEEVSGGADIGDGNVAVEILNRDGEKVRRMLEMIRRADATDGRFYLTST